MAPSPNHSSAVIVYKCPWLTLALTSLLRDPAFTNTVCIFDALDECRPSHRAFLIRKLEAIYTQTHLSGQQDWLNLLITSRAYYDIQEEFRQVTDSFPHIHVRGEEENVRIHEEISMVAKMGVAELGKSQQLIPETQGRLRQQLLQMEHRTCLWLHLVMDDIRTMFRTSLRPEAESIQLIPNSVSAAYAKISHNESDVTNCWGAASFKYQRNGDGPGTCRINRLSKQQQIWATRKRDG